MFSWLQSKERREYFKTVDDCLRVLFSSFPPEVIEPGRQLVDIDRVKRGTFKLKDRTGKQAGVMTAQMIIGRAIEQMGAHQRAVVKKAIDSRDHSDAFFVGFAAMLDYTRQLTDEMHVRLLSYEVLGRLDGMSEKAIHSRWMESEVNRVSESLRDGTPLS